MKKFFRLNFAKPLATLAVSILIAVASVNPSFAEWSTYHTIDYLKVEVGGTYVVLTGYTNTFCPANYFFFPNTTSNYKERTAYLMAAKLSGMQVRISFYECNADGSILASSIVTT